jgi:hypothetical protein
MIRRRVTRLWTSPLVWVVLAVIAVSAVQLSAMFGVGRARLREWAEATAPGQVVDQHPASRTPEKKGVHGPPTVPAEAAKLSGDDDVIGVEVNGKARAYTVRALSRVMQHIVNDELGGVPISVTYCDLDRCTRVYTSHRRSEPLDIALTGFLARKGMILKIEGVDYQQQSGDPTEPGPHVRPFPYEDQLWVRTTWRQWKQLHPETDVYIGEY